MFPSIRRDEPERGVLLESLGALYTQGFSIAWNKLYPAGGKYIHLPAMPWQRQRYWIDTKSSDSKNPWQGTKKGHPLLGESMNLANSPSTFVWQTTFDHEVLNFLGDHRIENEIVFPAAAYIEMALQSAKETGLNNSHVLSDFVFKERLIFQGGKPTSVQALLSPLQEDSFLFSVYSRTVPEENWKLYASATFIKNQAAGDLVALFRTSPEVIRQESTSEFTAEEFYQTAQSRGLQYGPGFRVLQHVWSKDDESVGHISLPEVIQNEISIYQIHPALLDGCLQVLAAMVRGSFEHDLYLPTGCRSIRMLSQPERDLWSHVSISPASAADGDFLTADIRLFDSNNQTVGELIGFRLQRTSRHIRHLLSRQNSWLYQLQWQASPEPGNSPVTFRGGKHWLIFADDEGLGEELAMQLEAGGDHCYLIRVHRDDQKIGRHK